MSSASLARPQSGRELEAGAVAVRLVRLSGHRGRLPALASALSADERRRAARFRRRADAEAFVLRRGILRELVGGYLGTAAAAVRFSYGRWDKPSVDGPVSFNASASGDVALYAFAVARAVGIDVERVRPLPDLDDVAARISSPAGAAAFRVLPDADRLPGFFAAWTQKEAYVKALGDGFAAPLDAFEVPLRPGVGSSTVVEGRRIEVLAAPAGYAAAVAAEGDDWRATTVS